MTSIPGIDTGNAQQCRSLPTAAATKRPLQDAMDRAPAGAEEPEPGAVTCEDYETAGQAGRANQRARRRCRFIIPIFPEFECRAW